MAEREGNIKCEPDRKENCVEYTASMCVKTRIGVICKVGTKCILFSALKITSFYSSGEGNECTERAVKNNVPSIRFIQYSCEKCCGETVVSTLEDLKQHIYSVHLNAVASESIETNNSNEQPNVSGRDYYTCEKCGGKFFEEYRLKLHIRHTHKQRQNGCKHCGQIVHSHQIHKCPHFLAKKREKNKIQGTKKKGHLNSRTESLVSIQNYRGNKVDKILESVNSDLPYVCPVCRKLFKYNSTLKRHLYIHTGERPYPCDICKEVFNDAEKLKVHKKIHSLKESSYVRKKLESLMQKVKSGERFEPYICPVYGGSSQDSTSTSLKSHLQTHIIGDPFSCNFCEESFSDITSFRAHKQLHHENIKVDISYESQTPNSEDCIIIQTLEEPKTCINSDSQTPYSEDCFMQVVEVSEDCFIQGVEESPDIKMVVERDEYSAEESEESEESLKQNMSNRRYNCDKCGRNFSLKNDLTKHLTAHIGEDSNSGNLSKSEFDVTYVLDAHQKYTLVDKLMQNFKSVGPYDCFSCGRGFSFKHSLKRHLFLHLRYACNICWEAFGELNSLISHKKLYHFKKMKPGSSSPNNGCSINWTVTAPPAVEDEAFKSNEITAKSASVLNIHEEHETSFSNGKEQNSVDRMVQWLMKNVNPDGPYDCVECGKNFLHKGDLERHLFIHTGKNCPSCNICKKEFDTPEELNIHNKFCHGKEENPINMSVEKLMQNVKSDGTFDCVVCGRNFTFRNSLKRHLFTHTGEIIPYSCDLCRKKFVGIQELNDHKELWHGILKDNKEVKIFVSETVESLMQNMKNTGPFDCVKCGRSFTHKHSLKRHLFLHTNEKPYSCDLCNRNFIEIAQLNTHKEISHGIPKTNRKTSNFFGKSVESLMEHVNPDGPYVCVKCKKIFSHKNYLRRHLHIHINEGPYSCNLCKKSFVNVNLLNEHRELCNLEEVEELPESEY